MAKEVIKSDRTIQALKPGSGRLSDGSGLYLLPFLNGDGAHGWRFDYTYEGKRKTISLGVYPQVGLALARERADKARALVAAGGNPSKERKDTRALVAARNEAERRVEVGAPAIGSFEEVARRWFATKEDGWVESYSSKIIARLEGHVFPYLGTHAIGSIGAKELLEVCRRIEDQGTRETAHRALEWSTARTFSGSRLPSEHEH